MSILLIVIFKKHGSRQVDPPRDWFVAFTGTQVANVHSGVEGKFSAEGNDCAF